MSPLASTLDIAAITASDLAEAHGLTAALRWPHRHDDWRVMLQLGVGIRVRDEAGALVGTAMLWHWGNTACTVGSILVRQDRQGQGLGQLLVERLIGIAGGRAMRLHATEAGVRIYERAGFRQIGSVRQMQGHACRQATRVDVREARNDDHGAIVDLDAAQFGARRERLIQRILADGQGRVMGEARRVTGFAVTRTFGHGALVGPVVAQSEGDAEALAVAALDDGFNRIDLTDAGGILQARLERAGLKVVDTVAVMTRGAWPPGTPLPIAYALASQAFG